MLRTVAAASMVTLALGCAGTRTQRSLPSRPFVLSELSAKPRLLNRAEIGCELLSLGPLALRYAGSGGTGGTAVLDLTVDSHGRVERVRLHRSSGERSADEALLRIAPVMRFVPGRMGHTAVPTRFTMPLSLDITEVPLPLPSSRFALRNGCG